MEFFFVSGFWARKPVTLAGIHFLPTLVRWGIFFPTRSFIDRTFHSLVTLRCLATWRLRYEPNEEALAHELTTCRCELLILKNFNCLLCPNSYTFFFSCRNDDHKGKQGEGLSRRGSSLGGSLFLTLSFWCREKEYPIQDNRYG